MFWSETLFKPVIAGGHGISTEAAAKDMSLGRMDLRVSAGFWAAWRLNSGHLSLEVALLPQADTIGC